MPTISDVFTISDGDQQRPALRTVSQQDPLMVAVSIYSPQGTRGDRDYPLFDAEAVFFGRDARSILDNFQPGDPIEIDGELVVEVSKDGYLNCDIEDASFSFVPTGRRQGRQASQQCPGGGRQGAPASQQGGDRQPPISPSADKCVSSRPQRPGGSRRSKDEGGSR